MKKIAVLLWLICLFSIGQVLASTTWPNQPTGSTVLSQFPFDATQGNGWSARYPTGAPIVQDPTAPTSPPNVLHYQWNHSKGYGDVSATGYTLPAGTRDVYLGVKWKPSSPFTGWTIPQQKIMLFDATYNHMYFSMYRKGGAYDYGLWTYSGSANNCHIAGGASCDLFYPNVNSPTVTLGQWHTLEAYMKASTCNTCQNGTVRMWLDGELVVNYTTLNTAYPDIKTVELHPVWDAVETSCPTCVDHHWFDHALVATGGTSTVVLPLMISSLTRTTGQVGKFYADTLRAQNGKAPYAWTITAGSLLPGLSFNKSTGVVSGSPTSGGKCSFTVKVMDSSVPAAEATKSFTIVASGTSIVQNGDPLTVHGSQLTVRAGMGSVLFQMPQGSPYAVSVFNLSGREIWRYTGSGAAAWNHGGKIGKGVYLVRLEQNGVAVNMSYCHIQ